MIRPLRALWSALKDLFEDLLLLVLCNMFWSIISLPLLIIASMTFIHIGFWQATLVGLLAIIPLAPATAGIYTIAWRITEGRASKIRDFFVGMRQYANIAWRTIGMWAGGLVIILSNIHFYAGVEHFIGTVVHMVWIYILLVWIALFIYLPPLMFLQEQPNLKIIWYNSTLMTLGRPIFTLITLIGMAVFIGLTLWLPLLLPFITVALLVQWSVRATQELIKEAEERRMTAEVSTGIATNHVQEEKGRRGQVRPK